MTFEQAKKIAFRKPILHNGVWVIDIYPRYVKGRHILHFNAATQ